MSDERPPCLTPGAQFHFATRRRDVSVRVDLPFDLALDEKQTRELEDRLHDALEQALAPLFAKSPTMREQADRLMDTVADANAGFPELRKRNPELYEQLIAAQRLVADCRKRASTNRRLLDMRLD